MAEQQLVDLRTVRIDPSLPTGERLRSFVAQIRDPYHFRVGETEVRVSFSDTQQTVTENFIDMIASL